MILAAGFGTRLAPWTDSIPKALIPVAGRPMIAYTVEALARAGVREAVVNAHHHAEQVEEHFRSVRYGIPVTVVCEQEILGTGGGILNARHWLDNGDPFLVHNVDIISDFDVSALAETREKADAFAMLAVNQRPTSRALVFDPSMRLLGKEAWTVDGEVYPDRSLRFGFCGIHCISPEIFTLGFPAGFSDIFDIYRSALRQGRRIVGKAFGGSWTDLGTVAAIREYEKSLIR